MGYKIDSSLMHTQGFFYHCTYGGYLHDYPSDVIPLLLHGWDIENIVRYVKLKYTIYDLTKQILYNIIARKVSENEISRISHEIANDVLKTWFQYFDLHVFKGVKPIELWDTELMIIHDTVNNVVYAMPGTLFLREEDRKNIVVLRFNLDNLRVLRKLLDVRIKCEEFRKLGFESCKKCEVSNDHEVNIDHLIKYFEPSDEEIAEMIKKPKIKNEWGKKLARILISKVEEYKDKVGPFRELVYQDNKVKIYFLEPDKGKKFAGPATFNKLYVKNGNILSSLKEEKGVYLGRYLDFIIKGIVSEIERKRGGYFKIRWVESLSDIYLEIPSKLLKWMNKRKKKIEIKGPVFLDIFVEMNR